MFKNNCKIKSYSNREEKPMPSIENKHNRVIINADDFGITKGVNKAIFELVDAGIVTSTSVMSNMPDYVDVVKFKTKIGISVHFNLTTGRPINDPKKIPTLVDEQGSFYELSELLKRMRQGQILKQEVEIEFDNQIKRLIKIGVQPDHVDTHESLLKYPFFEKVIREKAKKYSIMAVRTYTPRKFDYVRLFSPKKLLISLYLGFQKVRWRYNGFKVADRYDGLLKAGLDYSTALKKLEDIFYKLPKGVLEIGVHPGYCNDNNNKALGGYVKEREVELKALLSEGCKEIIHNSGAEVISFNDI